MPEPKPKDNWDKMDIVGKLLSGVVLAVIAVVIKSGTDRIAASQHRGDLVRALIADLTTQDQPTRQDVALIALNHSVGDANPKLVVEIVERLVLDTTAYSKTELAAGEVLRTVAFRILKERDSVLSDSVKQKVEQWFESRTANDPALRSRLRSDPDTTRAVLPDSTAQAAARLLAPVSSNVVYLQFQPSVKRQHMERLRKHLDKRGFFAPGVEYIENDFSSSVRYFHSEDSVQAARVAEITTNFLWNEQIPADSLVRQNMSGRGFRAPRGQIEVWLKIK